MKRYYTLLITFFVLLEWAIIPRLSAQSCWQALAQGAGNHPQTDIVNAMVAYNGDLIAAGVFDSAGGVQVNNIARWNGTSWAPLGTGIKLRAAHFNNGNPGTVQCLAVYNGELYAGGEFDSAGGVAVNNVARWDGNTWAPVGSGVPTFDVLAPFDTVTTGVIAMIVYNNELYLSGYFNTVGGITSHNIGRWNGTSWNAVGSGIGTTSASGSVVALSVINGMLYAGGDFLSASGLPAQDIAAWDGNAWTALGAGLGIDTMNMGGVLSIAPYHGEIYAAVLGHDLSYNTAYSISKWNGSTWSSVVGGPGTGVYYQGYVFDLLPFNGSLVAGGEFYNIGSNQSATSLASYDGNTWTNLVNTFDPNALFQCSAIYNSDLYVGGSFDRLNRTQAVNIGEYTCAVSGIHEAGVSTRVNVFPNPAHDVVNIVMDDVSAGITIEVYNLMGQRMLLCYPNSTATELNLAGVAAGTYWYRIISNDANHTTSGRFVIE